MKKLLGILVLGLLWFIPVSADHDDTKNNEKLENDKKQ